MSLRGKSADWPWETVLYERIGTRKEKKRIAAPVCALARNDERRNPLSFRDQSADWSWESVVCGNEKGAGMYYVYILSNATNTTIYTGVTNNLERRLWEHRNHVDRNSFTARYHVTKLVYFEMTTDVHSALEREKQIKSWSRKRKNNLIQKKNPEWRDLLPQGNVL